MEMNEEKSPFSAIIQGSEYGRIIAQDDQKKFALIESKEPEAAIHWLAIPYEDSYGTEEMRLLNSERFLELIDYALAETKSLTTEYPILGNGFTVKFHVGAFETIPHAKLHILSVE